MKDRQTERGVGMREGIWYVDNWVRPKVRCLASRNELSMHVVQCNMTVLPGCRLSILTSTVLFQSYDLLCCE